VVSLVEEKIIVREEEDEGFSKFFDVVMEIITLIIILAIIVYLVQLIQQSLQQAITSVYVVGRNVELEAILEGSTLPNKPVKFYYRPSGSVEWIYIDTIYTDSEGKARKIISLNRGIYDFKAVFEGDNDYDSSIDEKYNIEV